MQFLTLNNVPAETIVTAFNHAFENYKIHMQQTKESLLHKIKVEDIDLNLSVGAFDGEKLAGFIFFGIDDDVNGIKTAWDGGTGVIPTYRGKKLTQQMFEFILPQLKNNDVKKILLEVLEDNTSAYKIYEGIGFRKKRKLNAYKGTIKKMEPTHYNIEMFRGFDADALLALGDFLPPWQQMNKRIQNWGDAVATIGIKKNNAAVAYVHYNKSTKRILQFAVAKEYRNNGMGAALFKHIAGDNTTPIIVINVDDSCGNTDAFLKAIGLNYFISQFEMEIDIA